MPTLVLQKGLRTLSLPTQRPLAKAAAHVSCNLGALSLKADPSYVPPSLQSSSFRPLCKEVWKGYLSIHSYRSKSQASTFECWIVSQLLRSWYPFISAMNWNALIFPSSFQQTNNNKTIACKWRRRNPFWKQYSASDFWGIRRWYIHLPLWNSDCFSWGSFFQTGKCIRGVSPMRFPKYIAKITWTYTVPWECMLEMYTFECMCLYYLCMWHEGEEKIILVIFMFFKAMGV